MNIVNVMEAMVRYDLWKENALDDPDLIDELFSPSVSQNPGQIHERFYRDLEFGTGGLRGILGAGCNRMNIYVIRRATQGLCRYLKSSDLPRSVAISYDSRLKSRLFAIEAARVLAANHITAWVYPRLEPTPALSWAVRYLGCGAGICITASHNPAKYNGYKVYGPDGCQITSHVAKAVWKEIDSLDMFSYHHLSPDTPETARARMIHICSEEEGRKNGFIRDIPEECLQRFLDTIEKEQIHPGKHSNVKVVYTPLNGSGLECITQILQRIGIHDVTVVPEQQFPDGHFPTCPYPNPEIPEALERGLKLCETIQPDLLLATDPDCDRMGVAAPKNGKYVLLTGNEMGILLFDYICQNRIANSTMPKDPVAITSIVSTDMADAIATKYGVEMRRVMTGFKFIGEQIALLEAEGHPERYIFGFEESCGYLSGTYVRDKDGVNASMLCCEMAAWYKEQGLSLIDALERLYKEHGCFHNHLASFTFEGAAGMEIMGRIMKQLRTQPPVSLGALPLIHTADYLTGDGVTLKLPASDVLEFQTTDSKVLVRPSGTEPKIKIYLSSRANSMVDAKAQNQSILKELTAVYFDPHK